MVIFLRALFAAILAAMLAGTLRASLAQAIFDVPPEVYLNPWFQVTLLDAYCAFLTVFVTRRPGKLGLPLGLTVAGVLVYLLGAKNVLFP